MFGAAWKPIPAGRLNEIAPLWFTPITSAYGSGGSANDSRVRLTPACGSAGSPVNADSFGVRRYRTHAPSSSAANVVVVVVIATGSVESTGCTTRAPASATSSFGATDA